MGSPADRDPAVPASVRAQLVAALEASERARPRTARAATFLTRVAGRVRRPDQPMGPSAVRAAKLTRTLTARFGFADDVAEVFVALAAALADESAEMFADELSRAEHDREGHRLGRVASAKDYARVRARLGQSFLDEVVPGVAGGMASFLPGLALRRPLDHPSLAVGAVVAGGLASSALVGTSAVPVALALSVVTEAAETYAQASVLATRMRADGHEPTLAELVDELAAVAGDGVLGRTRPEASTLLRTTALPRLAATLEKRVGVRVASLATVVGPAVVEGGLTAWGLVKARRHHLGRARSLAPGADAGSVPPSSGEADGRRRR